MPGLVIYTNILKSKIPVKFLPEVTALMSQLVGKSQEYIAVNIQPEQMLTFGGTSEPAAMCNFYCVGKMGPTENNHYTEKLMEKFQQDLGIQKERVYIHFFDMARDNVGWGGKTIAAYY